MTFSSDSRFKVTKVPNPQLGASDWTLEVTKRPNPSLSGFNPWFNSQIRNITFRDEGWYDCQVNTEPKVSSKTYLKVVSKGFFGHSKDSQPWKVRNPRPTAFPALAAASSLSPVPLLQDDSPRLGSREMVPQIKKYFEPKGTMHFFLSLTKCLQHDSSSDINWQLNMTSFCKQILRPVKKERKDAKYKHQKLKLCNDNARW